MRKVTHKPAPVRTVKVKLLKGVVLGPDQEDGEKGEIIEVPRHLATMLIAHGQAEETDEGDPLQYDESPAGNPDEIKTLTVEAPTSRDPKPSRRGKSGNSEG